MNELNSENSIKIRRLKDHLAGSGKGYIFFGAWSVIKTVMITTMNRQNLDHYVKGSGFSDISDIDPKLVFLAVVITFLLTFVFVFLFHLKIGTDAIKYSKGLKKRRGFLLLAILMIVINISGIPYYFPGGSIELDAAGDTSIASLLVDLTETFVLCDIIYCTLMIGKLLENESEA